VRISTARPRGEGLPAAIRRLLAPGAPPRARGWLRHYAGLLSPGVASAMPLVFERARAQRLRRAVATVGGGVVQRGRPARPRMRALAATPGGQLRWRAVPAPPTPGPRGAVVRPIAVATCDIDCPLVLGATPLPLPLHLGHECVAEVLAVGEQVRTVAPGDRVIVPFQISCGACPACLAGRTGNCTSVPPLSMYGMGALAGHWGGAFADQLAVPYAEAMLVPLPAGIDPAAAASLADNVCDAYRHIAPHLPALLARDPDAEVLLFGTGHPRSPFGFSVPLYAGLIARAYGARRVTLVDARPAARAHARRLGFEALRPRRLRRRPPAPLVVDFSVDGLHAAIARVAPDGVCTSSGGFHHAARVPVLNMYIRNVTLHLGRTHARALIPGVLELMADGRLRPELVTTQLASLDDAPLALQQHCLGGGVKTVLTA
jgi:alcohol dehydrogenase